MWGFPSHAKKQQDRLRKQADSNYATAMRIIGDKKEMEATLNKRIGEAAKLAEDRLRRIYELEFKLKVLEATVIKEKEGKI